MTDNAKENILAASTTDTSPNDQSNAQPVTSDLNKSTTNDDALISQSVYTPTVNIPTVKVNENLSDISLNKVEGEITSMEEVKKPKKAKKCTII